MNNFIYYFYNIKVENIKYYQKYYTFIHDGYIYRLYLIQEDINTNSLINLNQKLLKHTLINEIILNKNREIISTYNNQNYLLMKLFTNPNKKITLEELDYMIYAFPSSSSVCLYKLHNIHYDF